MIEHCGLTIDVDSPPGAPAPDERVAFLGDDANGVPLEVIAIEVDEDDLLVIHAMKLHAVYAGEYMEALAWRTVP